MGFRTLLRIPTRRGLDGTLLTLSDVGEGSSLLFLGSQLDPVQIVAALEREDVEQLHAVLAEWLREGEPAAPAPLVAGRIGRGQLDAATVQFRTVAHPSPVPDQRVSGVHEEEPRRSPV